MLEISTFMEMKAKSCEKAESMENEIDDISFEELLAQEKKDAFWLVLLHIVQWFFLYDYWLMMRILCYAGREGKSKSCSVSGLHFC